MEKVDTSIDTRHLNDKVYCGQPNSKNRKGCPTRKCCAFCQTPKRCYLRCWGVRFGDTGECKWKTSTWGMILDT